jgi:hypothetical protein
MRNIIELAPTSAGASRYWSNGPDALLGAVPAAGAVGCPVDGTADGDGRGDDGGDTDGDADCGDGEVCGADDPLDTGGELEAGAAAAVEGAEW